MNRYAFTVVVECETQEQAEKVIAERTGYDEDYGFEYRVWTLDDSIEFV